MTVGIVGLGLIGGSFAKAYKAQGHKVYVYNRTISTAEFAILSGAADALLSRENISDCDLILVSLYPKASVKWLEDNGEYISKNTLVMDACGTKELICKAGFELAGKYGFTFVGGHPMAGTQYSGFKYSKENLFNNAPMVIVPERFDDIELLDRVKKALSPLKLRKISVTDAKKHDEMIAYTSQMCHIASNAFIKSPASREHKGYSAGSYKDLTRVAWLNEKMWTELFLENKEALINELDIYINNLCKYKTALENMDSKTLEELLREGRLAKEEADG